MSLLPKIERPKSYVTTPITKVDGWVIPFTMKEQKVLSIAEKSQEQSNILNAM